MTNGNLVEKKTILWRVIETLTNGSNWIFSLFLFDWKNNITSKVGVDVFVYLSMRFDYDQKIEVKLKSF